jgi:hypothetical protein
MTSGRSKQCDSPLAFMLIGRGCPYPALSRYAGEVRDMHIPVYFPDPGSRNDSAVVGWADAARVSVQATYGGIFEIHYADAESSRVLMDARRRCLLDQADRHGKIGPPPGNAVAAVEAVAGALAVPAKAWDPGRVVQELQSGPATPVPVDLSGPSVFDAPAVQVEPVEPAALEAGFAAEVNAEFEPVGSGQAEPEDVEPF